MEDSNVLVGHGWGCQREVHLLLVYHVLNALGFGRLNIQGQKYLEETSLGFVPVVIQPIRLAEGYLDGVKV